MSKVQPVLFFRGRFGPAVPASRIETAFLPVPGGTSPVKPEEFIAIMRVTGDFASVCRTVRSRTVEPIELADRSGTPWIRLWSPATTNTNPARTGRIRGPRPSQAEGVRGFRGVTIITFTQIDSTWSGCSDAFVPLGSPGRPAFCRGRPVAQDVALQPQIVFFFSESIHSSNENEVVGRVRYQGDLRTAQNQ